MAGGPASRRGLQVAHLLDLLPMLLPGDAVRRADRAEHGDEDDPDAEGEGEAGHSVPHPQQQALRQPVDQEEPGRAEQGDERHEGGGGVGGVGWGSHASTAARAPAARRAASVRAGRWGGWSARAPPPAPRRQTDAAATSSTGSFAQSVVAPPSARPTAAAGGARTRAAASRPRPSSEVVDQVGGEHHRRAEDVREAAPQPRAQPPADLAVDPRHHPAIDQGEGEQQEQLGPGQRSQAQRDRPQHRASSGPLSTRRLASRPPRRPASPRTIPRCRRAPAREQRAGDHQQPGEEGEAPVVQQSSRETPDEASGEEGGDHAEHLRGDHVLPVGSRGHARARSARPAPPLPPPRPPG